MAIQQIMISLKAAVTNLITNGTFTGAGAGWTFDTGGNFTGDIANFTSVADQKLTHTPAITFTSGVSYLISWDVANWTTGAAYPQLTTSGGAPAVSGTLMNGNGAHSETLVSNGNNSFRFVASSGSTNMSIDNVSIVAL